MNKLQETRDMELFGRASEILSVEPHEVLDVIQIDDNDFIAKITSEHFGVVYACVADSLEPLDYMTSLNEALVYMAALRMIGPDEAPGATHFALRVLTPMEG